MASTHSMRLYLRHPAVKDAFLKVWTLDVPAVQGTSLNWSDTLARAEL